MGKRLLSLLAAALIIVGASIYLTGGGPGEAPTLATADTSASQDPSAEAIKVHGHWRLDVFDADGALDRSVEFENALSLGGETILPLLLGRGASAGPWNVFVEDTSGQPCSDGTEPTGCNITEVDPAIVDGPHVFRPLTVDTSTPGELVLSGSFTVANTSVINKVSTQLLGCAPTVLPADCAASTSVEAFTEGGNFTTRFFTGPPDPVPVTEGQVVQVSVTITFS